MTVLVHNDCGVAIWKVEGGPIPEGTWPYAHRIKPLRDDWPVPPVGAIACCPNCGGQLDFGYGWNMHQEEEAT